MRSVCGSRNRAEGGRPQISEIRVLGTGTSAHVVAPGLIKWKALQ